MALGINFQPFKTQGSFRNAFNLESRGYVQGDTQDDPAVRLQLRSGWLPNSFEGSIWGGLPIRQILTPLDMNVVGNTLLPASETESDGFCVFNQAYHGVITAGNNVPQYAGGMTAHYYEYGSLARIPLPISTAVLNLATSGTQSVNQVFVWDPTNYVIDLQTADTGGGGGGGGGTRAVSQDAEGFEGDPEALAQALKDASPESQEQAAAAAAAEPRADTRLVLPIKLLSVSDGHNMAISVTDGVPVWDYNKPMGLFRI